MIIHMSHVLICMSIVMSIEPTQQVDTQYVNQARSQ